MTDVKETKELLIAVVRAGKLAIKLFKDGVDLSDAVAVVKAVADEDFRKCIADGAAGIENVPAEVKDIDVLEAGEILKALYEELQK